MPFLTKLLPNDKIAGITNGEVVLPLSSLDGLDDQTIVNVVRDLARDLEFLRDYLGSGEIESGTIEEAKKYVILQQQRRKTHEAKRQLTQQRRRIFNSQQAQLLLLLIDRDGYICRYPNCGVQEDLTIDHIVPISRGGSDDPSNLQLLCRKHNSQKGDRREPVSA